MYGLMGLLGLLCTLVLLRAQAMEQEEREDRYQLAIHAKLQNLSTREHVTLSGAYFVLGRRKRKCDIVVGGGREGSKGYDPYVSRIHAVLRYVDGEWRVSPVLRVESPFRTDYTQVFVNERQIGVEGAALASGDVIRLGNTMLRLMDTSDGFS